MGYLKIELRISAAIFVFMVVIVVTSFVMVLSDGAVVRFSLGTRFWI